MIDRVQLQKLRNSGSPNFNVTIGVLVVGTEEYHDVGSENPDGEKYDFMDSILIINNSAQPIEFRLNRSDVYPILPYQIQPVTGRSCRFYTIKNVGALDTVAGDIKIQYRRLPPQIVQTVQVR